MGPPVIRGGEGFTVEQVLNSDGFTLDTTDFVDFMGEEDEFEIDRRVEINNDEMMKLLTLEDDGDENKENMENMEAFVGIAFDTLLPKMTSIYGDGKVMKSVKKQGMGEVVPPGAQVTVEYAGYFEFQDEPFDSTLLHKDRKATLYLGRGSLIEGLDMGISTMRKHEKSLFIIQPELAYKALGCPPRVPPNSAVLFKVELIDFLDNGSADLYDELTNEEKRQYSKVKKITFDLMNTAADTFSRGKFKQATREYNRAVDYLEFAGLDGDEDENAMNKQLQRGLSNLIICYNKIGRPKLACSCFMRLPMDPSTKAYYHYGKALKDLGEYDDAMNNLQKANKMTPGSEEILKEIREVESCRKKYAQALKEFSQKSLKVENNEKISPFEKEAKNICEMFLKDTSIQKQKLPEGLTAEEEECFRKVAAAHNLSITKSKRFDVETLYLTKRNYYAK